MELQALPRFFGSICELGNVCCLVAMTTACAVINICGSIWECIGHVMIGLNIWHKSPEKNKMHMEPNIPLGFWYN